MDKRILLTLALGAMSQVFTHAWEPKGDKIKTVWAEQVMPENVWQSYPRPQLQRAEWINLNGLWKYAVTDQNTPRKNVSFEGEILVPFAIESSLSGVQKTFLPTDRLWYQREFTLDPSWKNKSTILHFGAVDYECQVWVNNRLVGTHKGGNNPFSFDITKYLKKSGPQSIEVAVTDPTDTESISRGKQQLNQEGIWYTPVSGIWQTVWLEAVNKTYIRQVLPSTDIERKSVKLAFDIIGAKGNEEVKIEVLDDGKVIKTVEQKLTNAMEIDVPNAVLWSPESPKLYHLNIVLSNGGRVLDRVKSYFALRKVDVRKDECGYNRICLNNQPIFWCGWQKRRVYQENQCIYIAEMENPWTLASDRILISEPEYEWECQWISIDGNKTAYPIRVNEAPQFFYSLKKDKLLIYYSASGNWTPYYCVGLLTADTDSDLLNPASWKKAPEPVFKQAPENHVYGPGSICFIPSPDGKEWYMLYHARKSLYDMLVLDSRTPRMQKIEWDKEGIPVLGIPQKEGFPLRKPSGTPERK